MINLLDNTTNPASNFKTKYWVEVIYVVCGIQVFETILITRYVLKEQ